MNPFGDPRGYKDGGKVFNSISYLESDRVYEKFALPDSLPNPNPSLQSVEEIEKGLNSTEFYMGKSPNAHNDKSLFEQLNELDRLNEISKQLGSSDDQPLPSQPSAFVPPPASESVQALGFDENKYGNISIDFKDYDLQPKADRIHLGAGHTQGLTRESLDQLNKKNR